MKTAPPILGFIIITVDVWLLIGVGALATFRVADFCAATGTLDPPSLMPFYTAMVFAGLETAFLFYHRRIRRRAFVMVSAALLFAASMFISYGTYRTFETDFHLSGGLAIEK